MIPADTFLFDEEPETEEQPSLTYKMDIDKKQIRGFADELEAMKQAVYKILLTERYQYIMYSWDYGIETLDLYGEPVSFVYPELERRITEALTWDERIQSVDGFEFNSTEKGSVCVSFAVHTIYGDIQAEKEVNF